jgi:acyl-CoA synthetase (NDP forming)
MFDEVEELVQGPVAFVSQSGGHTQTFLMNAYDYDIGFSKAISYGNALTLSAEDFLEYLAMDSETQIICMYIEGVKDGKRLFEKVRETNTEKPIIILKGGNTESGSRAVASHTGSMAGEKKIWDAFFKQTGAIQVDRLEEMVDITMCFIQLRPLTRVNAAVIGVGGGSTVANGDICSREGLVVPALSPRTITHLAEFIPLVNQGIANPLDIPSVLFHNETLLKTLKVLNDDSNVDIILLSIPAGIMSGVIGDVMTGFKACLNQFKNARPEGKSIVVAMSNEFTLSMTELCLQELRGAGITAFPSLTTASRALRRFSDYHSLLARRGCN